MGKTNQFLSKLEDNKHLSLKKNHPTQASQPAQPRATTHRQVPEKMKLTLMGSYNPTAHHSDKRRTENRWNGNLLVQRKTRPIAAVKAVMERHKTATQKWNNSTRKLQSVARHEQKGDRAGTKAPTVCAVCARIDPVLTYWRVLWWVKIFSLSLPGEE